MAEDLNQILDQTTAKFSKLDAMLKSMVASMTKLTNSMGKAGSNLGSFGFGGQQGLGGVNNQDMMSGSLGGFSFNVGPRGVMGLAAGKAALSMAGGVADMMPDVAMTMTRASGYYAAARMSGVSRQTVSMGTFSALNGGITQRGIDAPVAATFAQSGIAYGTSLYNTGTSFVRGMAGSLGIDNLQATGGFAATYSGRGASALMRGSGIMLTDPSTGEQLTTRELFGQLESRVVRNPNLSVEEINSAIRSGYLTESLAGAGLSDPTMQQGFFQYLRDKAQGKSTSWLEGDLGGQGDNPLSSVYKVESAATGAMEKGTDSYITGINTAAGALVSLHQAAGDLAAQFGALKSSVGYFMGDNAGKGVASGVMGAVGALGGGYLAARGMGLGKGDAGLGKGDAGLGKGGAGLGGVVKAGGATRVQGARGGGLIGAIAAAPTIIGGIQTGNGAMIGNGIGSVIGGIAGGALGSAFGPGGTFIGGYLGSTIGGMIGGGIGSLFGQGGDQTGTTNASAANNSASGKWLSHPVDTPKITAYFGQKYSSFDPSQLVWKTGHKGIDYAADTSTTIKASADGLAYAKSSKELGNYVLIDHQNGYYTFYCHLSSIQVGNGHVKRGQAIGKAGTTGTASSGVHLHFALSVSTSTADVIDPVPYLGGSSSSTGMTVGNDTAAGNGVSTTAGVAADMSASSEAGATGPHWSIGGTQVDVATSTGSTGIIGTNQASTGIIGTNQASTGVNSTSSTGTPSAWYGPNSAVANTTVPGAATGVDYVPQDGLYRLHQGESVLTSKETAERRDAARGGSRGGNSIVINVNVNDLSEDEAVRFSRRVKEILEKDAMTSVVGRK